jgi:hypothetical protein
MKMPFKIYSQNQELLKFPVKSFYAATTGISVLEKSTISGVSGIKNRI